MSGTRNRLILSAVGLGLMLGGALVYASVRKPRPSRARASQNSNRAEPSNRPASVRRVAIWGQLRPALNQLTDRLEHAGKERLIITGVLKEAGDNAASHIQLVSELPDRARLTIQHGINQRVLTFDGVKPLRGNQLDEAQLSLIESLVYDSPEHFFISETDGVATRSLGSRFRMDDGSFTDMYQIDDPIKLGSTARSQTKYYCFNSDTHLLDSVHYQITRNGLPIKIETHIDKWRKENGSMLPGRISRIENGVTIFSLTVTAVSVSPGTNDGIFVTP